MIVCPLRTRSAGVKRTRQEGQPVGLSGPWGSKPTTSAMDSLPAIGLPGNANGRFLSPRPRAIALPSVSIKRGEGQSERSGVLFYGAQNYCISLSCGVSTGQRCL